MAGLAKIVALILLTLALLIVTTEFHPDSWTSVGEFMGYPVVQIAQEGARGVIAIGQVDAAGAVVIAQAGYGLIAFAQVGAGVLFGIGQGMGGLVSFGQLSLGFFFALGQLAFGAQSIGQVGVISRDWLGEMSAELTELLRLRFQGNQEPEPEVTTEEDPSARPQGSNVWPDALLAHLKLPERPLTLALSDGRSVTAEVDRVVVRDASGATAHTVEDSDGGVVQLSRSQHRRRLGWLFQMFGGSAFEHRLHVELRHRTGLRVGAHAAVPEELLAGLPMLEQSGARVDRDELLELLAVLSGMRLRVAHNPATRVTIEERSLSFGTRLFHLAKWSLRPGVWLLHLAPLVVVPKLALRWMGSPGADLITVAYVGALLYFFTVLALLALMFLFVGPASKRYSAP